MSRVLVVDVDAWTRQMISSVLTHNGHSVDVAADGWEALIRAGRERPDLLIIEVQLPSMDGWQLVETMRSRPDMGDIPALFLTSFMDEETRGPSFRSETDDAIAKPFRLEDLHARVTDLLSKTRPKTRSGGKSKGQASPLPRPRGTSGSRSVVQPPPLPNLRASQPLPDVSERRRAALSGALDQFGLSSVLVMLELERKSGITVVNGLGRQGRLFLREGRVVRASIDGDHDRKGALAVYELLTWIEGRFEFHPCVVDGEDEIGSSTSFLLLEGARLSDEAGQQPDAKKGNN